MIDLRAGDCRHVLASLPDASVDAVVTDPPYELGFMGKKWDGTGIAYDVTMWAEVLRVLKPGGHLLSFGGTRTWHRMACAVEDAGFEMRDSIAWLYGSGFPKSLDVGKAIDKAAGAEREVVGSKVTGMMAGQSGTLNAANGFAGGQMVVPLTAPATPDAVRWDGWGTALKPAHEPIVVARKPLVGTVAANVVEHGTGALNIDGCRIGTTDALSNHGRRPTSNGWDPRLSGGQQAGQTDGQAIGRWPANVVLDDTTATGVGAEARYFYCAKAPTKERPRHDDGTAHPTVKPLTLMRWLVRLVTPPGGTVLDPFTGSGTTLEAALLEGFHAIGIEANPDYLPLIRQRLARHDDTLFGATA